MLLFIFQSNVSLEMSQTCSDKSVSYERNCYYIATFVTHLQLQELTWEQHLLLKAEGNSLW